MKKIIYTIALFIIALTACQQEEELLPQTDPNASVGTQPTTILKGKVWVKFKESAEPQLQVVKTKSGLSTGISSLDLAGIDLSVYKMVRVFPPAGKFEARHREVGLHLWYEINFDEVIPTSKAIETYSKLPEVDKVVPIPEARLNDYQMFDEPLEPLRSMLNNSRTKAGSEDEEEMPFNDPRLKEQWHYHNAGEKVNGLTGALEGADIGLFDAWKIETGSTDVIVAVMDGGIQYNHPDLAANMWVNEAELNGTEGVDDDGNGYVDDIYGWNFVTAKTVTNDDGNSYEDNGAITQHMHGTHCAGTISAVNGNSIGVSGIAGGSGLGDGVRLMSCQIFHNNPSTGLQEAYANPNMYVYAADMGAVISSNSWTNGPGEESAFLNSPMRTAIDYFIKYAGTDISTKKQNGPMNGGLVVFASANSNSDTKEWPCGYEKCFTVSAIAHNFKRASYSNYGTWVDISAPGGEQSYGDIYAILSTTVDGGYAWAQGTSMACPHVSGCAALVLSKFQGIGYTPAELEERLINSTKEIDGYNPKYKGLLGAGCIDVGLALTPPSTEAPDSSHLTLIDAYDDWAIVEWQVKAAPDGPMSKYVISWSTSPITTSTTENNDVQSKTVNVRYVKAGSIVRDTIRGLEIGETYYFTLKAYDRWGGISQSAPEIAKTITENFAPVLTKTWNSDILLDEGSSRTLVLKTEDPEQQHISCLITPELPWLTAQNEGDTLINIQIAPDYRSAGTYALELTVTDQYGKRNTTNMNIEVVYKEVAPEIIHSFGKLQIKKNAGKYSIDLTKYFTDPKGRTLIYEVENSSPNIATAQRNGEKLVIEPQVIGQTEILVRALNEAGLSASQRFSVEVTAPEVEDNLANALTVYPNPVRKNLNISLQPSARGEVTLKLYNAAGRLMILRNVAISDNGYILDMSGMQAGTYSLSVEGNAGNWKKNIIKI